jgi:hypothetical protein
MPCSPSLPLYVFINKLFEPQPKQKLRISPTIQHVHNTYTHQHQSSHSPSPQNTLTDGALKHAQKQLPQADHRLYAKSILIITSVEEGQMIDTHGVRHVVKEIRTSVMFGIMSIEITPTKLCSVDGGTQPESETMIGNLAKTGALSIC